MCEHVQIKFLTYQVNNFININQGRAVGGSIHPPGHVKETKLWVSLYFHSNF